MKVLLVGDSIDPTRAVRAHLEREGIAVEAVGAPAAALLAASAGGFDVAIVDIDGAVRGGAALLAGLRNAGPSSHVIALGSDASEVARVTSLQMGADEYVTKPFFARDLTARALAFRRRAERVRRSRIDYGWLVIDVAARRATLHGVDLDLATREFDVLAFLAARPGLVFSRDELLEFVWHSASSWQQARTVTEHIRRIRNKLGHDGREIIVSVRGIGYRFDPPVPLDALSQDTTSAGSRAAVLVHVDGLIVHADEHVAAVLGSGEADLEGRQLVDVFPPALRPTMSGRLDSLRSGGSPDLDQRNKMLVTRSSEGGEQVTIEIVSTPVEWEGGQARRVELREIAGDAALLLRSATGSGSELPDAAIVTDAGGRIILWNPAAERLYGWAAGEVVGSRLDEILVSGPPLTGPGGAQPGDGSRWHGSLRQAARDGTDVLVDATSSRIDDEHGVPAGQVTLARHISPTVLPGSSFARWPTQLELEEALAGGQFEVRYQPMVDFRTGTVAGADVVLFWNHPEKGLLPPDQFSGAPPGIVVELDRLLAASAIEQAGTWPTEEAGIHVGIRLSTPFLAAARTPSYLSDLVESAGLVPAELWIEIEERSLVEDFDDSPVISGLARTGFRIVADRFGTGWASFTLLKSIPVHAVMIDESLMTNIDKRPSSARFARSVAELADDIGFLAVGTGVRTGDEEGFLRDIGVHLMKGSRYGLALSADELRSFRTEFGPEAVGSRR